ncbi:MAG: hypothetical protein O3C21_20355, partial [Verrucomicrobia bacterium]|nr:hypothetical protein [Verrucomicrobiota bacterium]
MHILAQGSLPTTSLLALLAFGIVLLLILILRFKLQAFLSLLVASVAVAMGAVFVNGDVETAAITSGASAANQITLEVPAHGRSVGAIVEISGTEPNSYNGVWKTKEAPTA